MGTVGGAVGVAIVVALSAAGTPRLWRLAAFAPFWLGGLGWFQARAKT